MKCDYTGDQVVAWRDDLGLNQSQLAKLLHTSSTSLKRIESFGKAFPVSDDVDLEKLNSLISQPKIRIGYACDLALASLILAGINDPFSGKTKASTRTFYQQEELLNVTSINYSISTRCFEKLIHNELDVATVFDHSFTEQTLMQYKLTKLAHVVVAPTCVKGIAVRNFNIRRADDFKKLCIGALYGSLSQHIAMLVPKSPKTKKNKFIDEFDATELANKLKYEVIDIFFVTEPRSSILLNEIQEQGEMCYSIDISDYISFSAAPIKYHILCRNEILKRRDVVLGLSRSFARANNFFIRNKGIALELVADQLETAKIARNEIFQNWFEYDFATILENPFLSERFLQSKSKKTDSPPVRLSFINNLSCALFYAAIRINSLQPQQAHDFGWNDNTKFRATTFARGLESYLHLLSGHADYAVVPQSTFRYIRKAGHDPIATIEVPAHLTTALSASQINVSSVIDLVKQQIRLGVLSGSYSEYLVEHELNKYLRSIGVDYRFDPKRYVGRVGDTLAKKLARCLERGEITVLLGKQPFISTVANYLRNPVSRPVSSLFRIPINPIKYYLVSGEKGLENSEALKYLFRSLIFASDFLRYNKLQSYDLLAEMGIIHDRELLSEAVWSAYEFTFKIHYGVLMEKLFR